MRSNHLGKAERPLIVAGQGVFQRKAWDALKLVAEKQDIAVVTSGPTRVSAALAAKLRAGGKKDRCGNLPRGMVQRARGKTAAGGSIAISAIGAAQPEVTTATTTTSAKEGSRTLTVLPTGS